MSLFPLRKKIVLDPMVRYTAGLANRSVGIRRFALGGQETHAPLASATIRTLVRHPKRIRSVQNATRSSRVPIKHIRHEPRWTARDRFLLLDRRRCFAFTTTTKTIDEVDYHQNIERTQKSVAVDIQKR